MLRQVVTDPLGAIGGLFGFGLLQNKTLMNHSLAHLNETELHDLDQCSRAGVYTVEYLRTHSIEKSHGDPFALISKRMGIKTHAGEPCTATAVIGGIGTAVTAASTAMKVGEVAINLAGPVTESAHACTSYSGSLVTPQKSDHVPSLAVQICM